MSRYATDCDPTNSDFEQIALKIVELDPHQELIRGPSNDGGDDGIHRHSITGTLSVTEAKYYRQTKNLPMRDIVNLGDATHSASEMYNTPAKGTLFTTAGGLSKGAKAKQRELEEKGVTIEVVSYNALRDIANGLPEGHSLRNGIEGALNKKARLSKVGA